MVTDGQVRKLLRDFDRGEYLAVAARRAGMDEKTARTYRSLGVLPSARKQQRAYRTRKDPFAEVWPMVQERLEREPSLQAKTLFDWIMREVPDSSWIVIAARSSAVSGSGAPRLARRARSCSAKCIPPATSRPRTSPA